MCGPTIDALYGRTKNDIQKFTNAYGEVFQRTLWYILKWNDGEPTKFGPIFNQDIFLLTYFYIKRVTQLAAHFDLLKNMWQTFQNKYYSNTNEVTRTPTAPQEAMVQLCSWMIPGLACEHLSPWRVPVEKQQTTTEQSSVPSNDYYKWTYDFSWKLRFISDLKLYNQYCHKCAAWMLNLIILNELVAKECINFERHQTMWYRIIIKQITNVK